MNKLATPDIYICTLSSHINIFSDIVGSSRVVLGNACALKCPCGRSTANHFVWKEVNTTLACSTDGQAMISWSSSE